MLEPNFLSFLRVYLILKKEKKKKKKTANSESIETTFGLY